MKVIFFIFLELIAMKDGNPKSILGIINRLLKASPETTFHGTSRLLERVPREVMDIVKSRIKRVEPVIGSEYDMAIELYNFGSRRFVPDPSKSRFDKDGFTNASNGNMIVAVFRGGRLTTIMLRRSPESEKPQPFTAEAMRVDYAFRWEAIEAAMVRKKP